MSILGIDIGTTSCAAGVYAPDGTLLCLETSRYPLRYPEPGAMELDAEQVLSIVRATIQAAVREIHSRIRAMSISSQGETIVPVDTGGRPLGPALTTFDRRPEAETARLVERIGRERLQQITGLPPHAMYSLPKMLLWKSRRPDIVDHAEKFLCMGSFFLRRLSLEPVMDYSMGGRTLAMDLREKSWSAEILAAADVPIEKLPRLLQAGTFLGLLPPHIAREYGLPKGVQVILGGHDQACGALGCGAIEPGMAMDATGAVECLVPVLSEPVINGEMLENHYGCYPHLLPGRYLTLAYNFTAGSLLHWYRVTFGHVEEEEAYMRGLGFYEILVSKAGAGPSPVLVLPHFTAAGTPTLDPQPCGAVIGLTLTTPREQILKGMLDALAFEMRLNLDCLERAGVRVDQVRVVGGGATSRHWLQLKAAVYRRTVEGIDISEAPVRGAAMLAGIGAGIYRNAQEALAHTSRNVQRIEPEPAAMEQYERQYQRFLRLYPALRPVVDEE